MAALRRDQGTRSNKRKQMDGEPCPESVLYFVRNCAASTPLAWEDLTRDIGCVRILFCADNWATAEKYNVGGGRRRYCVRPRDGEELKIVN
eukprot:COSAG01_NODE_65482_length_273_cov_0.597701_1_plen_90_part_11